MRFLVLVLFLLLLGVVGVSASNESVIVLSVDPVNGSVFVMGDSIPPRVSVEFNGTLDYNASSISLLYNNESVNWISFVFGFNSFRFNFQQMPDGVYSGSWVLVSEDNVSTFYDYEFRVIRSAPPLAFNVNPGVGVYTTEEVVLSAQLPSAGFVLQWILSDGFPSAGSANWRSLVETSPGVFSVPVNFGELGSGAIYLKVLDEFGNFRIQPTGIVSSDVLKLEVASSRISVFPGHLAEFGFSVSRKDISKRLLRCRLSNFVSDNVFGDVFIAERSSVVLGNNRISVFNDFQETLTVPGVPVFLPKLVIDVPIGLEQGIYTAELECLVTG